MIEILIPGKPEQQGSKNQLPSGVMIDSNTRLRSWRQDAIACIQNVYTGPMIMDPVAVFARFVFPRPRHHYGTGRNAQQLKESAPLNFFGAPDLDKLQRALGDALTQSGLLYDDRLITAWNARKTYGHPALTIALVVPLTSTSETGWMRWLQEDPDEAPI